MGLGTADWASFFFLGATAFAGTFGKRLVRVVGVAAMPFAFAGLVLSLNHHGRVQSQGPIADSAPAINTNTEGAGTDALNAVGPQRLAFDSTIGNQLASKLPTGRSIEIIAVGSRIDWNIADQYAQYLKAKGLDVSFSRSAEVVPPADRKITIHDDPATPPIIVIIAPSAL